MGYLGSLEGNIKDTYGMEENDQFYENMKTFIVNCAEAISKLENKCADLEEQNVNIKQLYTELESKYDKLLKSVTDIEYGNYGVEGWSTHCMANHLCSKPLL